MIYFEQIPTGRLSKYIGRFWYCQAGNLTNTMLTIPLLHHELVFNFSGNYCLFRDGDLKSILKAPQSWISGIQTRPVISKSAGKHEMMGVLFKPGGLKAFSKYHSSEFENSFIDATLVFDSSFVSLLDQIQNAESAAAKIAFIESYLFNKINFDDPPGYLHASLGFFGLETGKRISIRDTCKQIMVSNKSLIKSYQKHIGITPVKYLQLRSVNKAIYHLSKAPGQSLTKLAYDLNFYDQAHFINSFKSVTSLTPGQYSDYVLNRKIDTGSPNFILMEG